MPSHSGENALGDFNFRLFFKEYFNQGSLIKRRISPLFGVVACQIVLPTNGIVMDTKA
jgi:hypothetical protein